MPTPDEFAALQRALAETTERNAALSGELGAMRGELRVTRTERDLLQEQLNQFIDGYRYLAALLVRLPLARTADDYEALLPWRIVTSECLRT